MANQSLWEFLLNLLSDPEARAEFNEDPEGTLREAGFEDVSPHDLKDAIDLVNDQSEVHYDAPQVTNDDVTAKEYIQTVINNVENHNYVDNSYYSDSSTNIEADGDVTIDNSYDYDDHSIHGDGNTSIDGDVRDSNLATGEDSVAGDGNVRVEGAVGWEGENGLAGDRVLEVQPKAFKPSLNALGVHGYPFLGADAILPFGGIVRHFFEVSCNVFLPYTCESHGGRDAFLVILGRGAGKPDFQFAGLDFGQHEFHFGQIQPDGRGRGSDSIV